MRRAAAAIGAVAALGACHHPPAAAPVGNTGPEIELPATLLPRDAAAYRPVRRIGDTAYVVMQLEMAEDDTVALHPAVPACWIDPDPAANPTCPESVALPAALMPAAPAARLTVIGATGPCEAMVGTPTLLSTPGCEHTVTVGAPLTGCGADLAPFGVVGAVDRDLRYRPGDEPFGAEPDKLTDEVARHYAAAWLREPDFTSAPRVETVVTIQRADAGREILQTVELGALMGDRANECELEPRYRDVVGLRRGATLTPISVPARWDGIVAWRGRVAAVVSGAPVEVTLHVLDDAGHGTQVFTGDVWRENPECVPRMRTVNYPCGP